MWGSSNVAILGEEANRHLNITWCGSSLQYNFTSRYLGVTLDRSPTFKQHCANAKMKVSSRNNLLNKRTGGLTRPLCARLLLLSATQLQNMPALSGSNLVMPHKSAWYLMKQPEPLLGA